MSVTTDKLLFMTLVQFSLKFFHYIQQVLSSLNSFYPFPNVFPSPVLQQKHPHLLYGQNYGQLLTVKTEVILLFPEYPFPGC